MFGRSADWLDTVSDDNHHVQGAHAFSDEGFEDGESNDDYACDDDETGVMLGDPGDDIDEVFDPDDEE